MKETWTDERGTVWRKSDESGIPITVTRMSDPAYLLLIDGVETVPVVHKKTCYICEDPEFAQMGLPLCRKCPACGGHVAADDSVCDECGLDDQAFWEAEHEGQLVKCFSTGHPDYQWRTPTYQQLVRATRAWLVKDVEEAQK